MIKKLCIFTLSFAFNRQVLLNFLEKSLPKEVELFLFTPKDCRDKFYSKRIKLVKTQCTKYNSFFELRKFCRKEKIDRIFNMGALPQEGFVMAFATIFAKTDFICHLVVNPFNAFFVKFDKKNIKAFFELLLFYPLMLFPKKFYVVSKDITEISKRYFFFAKKRIDFLRYIVDTNLFVPKNRLEVRKKLNLPLNKKIVISVGRIEYAKGSDRILELAKRNKDILFILIGDLNDQHLKRENLQNIKIVDSISSKDCQNLSDYYNAADLCISLSRTEGFPLTPREAMASGTPAVVTDVAGLRMIKEAIITPSKIEAINKMIKGFFKLSKKERDNLSVKSRNFVVNECSYKACKSLYKNGLLKK